MKKLSIIATICLLLAACTEKVKKIPSSITAGNKTFPLKYDDENRFTTVDGLMRDDGVIVYDVNNNIVKIDGRTRYDDDITFLYDGDQIYAHREGDDFSDTLILDANGQLIKLVRWWDFDLWGDKELFKEERSFIYDSDENLTEVKYSSTKWKDTITYTHTYVCVYTYSDEKSVWRHLNMPDWYLLYMTIDSRLFYHLRKNGCMPKQCFESENGQEIAKFAYKLDSDGYVKQMDIDIHDKDEKFVWTFNYAPLK